jgi:hypothetical protein
MSRYITGTGGGGTGGGGAGGTVRQERFLTSGTFTVPSGVTSAEVLVVGGGGGGGRGSSWQISCPGGGGQGGQVKIEVVNLTGISSCGVIVGSGGSRANGSSSDSYNGQPGGRSSFSYGGSSVECVGGRQGVCGGVGGQGGPHWQGNYNGSQSPDGDNYGEYNEAWHNSNGHTRGAGGHGRNSSGHGHNARQDGMNGMAGYGGGGGGGYYDTNNYNGFGGGGADGGGISTNYDWWHGQPGANNTSQAYFKTGQPNTGGGGAGGNYPNNEYGGHGGSGIVIVTYSV